MKNVHGFKHKHLWFQVFVLSLDQKIENSINPVTVAGLYSDRRWRKVAVFPSTWWMISHLCCFLLVSYFFAGWNRQPCRGRIHQSSLYSLPRQSNRCFTECMMSFALYQCDILINRACIDQFSGQTVTVHYYSHWISPGLAFCKLPPALRKKHWEHVSPWRGWS